MYKKDRRACRSFMSTASFRKANAPVVPRMPSHPRDAWTSVPVKNRRGARTGAVFRKKPESSTKTVPISISLRRTRISAIRIVQESMPYGGIRCTYAGIVFHRSASKRILYPFVLCIASYTKRINDKILLQMIEKCVIMILYRGCRISGCRVLFHPKHAVVSYHGSGLRFSDSQRTAKPNSVSNMILAQRIQIVKRYFSKNEIKTIHLISI